MTVNELREMLSAAEPPAGLPALVVALWWDAKGDWNRAHDIAQEVESRDAAWVHAYLHRKEGDDANAGYWYGCAAKSHSHASLDAEWTEIADALSGG
jgi:hypothetical protein